MMEKEVFDDTCEFLKTPEVFYFDAHQKIYKAISTLATNNEPIDVLTVTQQLKKTNDLEEVGGAYYITKLTNVVGSTANVITHAQLLLQFYTARQIIRISGNAINQSYERSNDPFDILDDVEVQLSELSLDGFIQEVSIGEASMDAVIQIDQAAAEIKQREKNGETGLVGVPSGFTLLDLMTYGWQLGLIILAARPAVGKTAFSLNLLRNAAKKGFSVALSCLEMSREQLSKRLLSIESEVPMERIMSSKLRDGDSEKLMVAANELNKLKMIIDDTSSLSVMELRAKARRWVKKYNIQLLVIDYLQLMNGKREKNGNREQEISFISRQLKVLAMELKIPIIALSQLSRGVEQRASKEPMLSDLRESGAIEQDADMVMFLYEEENIPRLKMAKNRNGKNGIIQLKSDLSIQKFYDIGSNPHWVDPLSKEPKPWENGFTPIDEEPF